MGFEIFKTCLEYIRSSATIIVVLVYATLMLDNMLLTAVVPILPEYFFKQHLEEVEITQSNISNTSLAYLHSTATSEPTILSETLATFKSTVETENSSHSDPLQCNISKENQYLAEENLYIGILFASKPLVQIISNVAVGPISDRIGFEIPMFTGYLVMCISAVIFAFGSNYSILLIARAIQGIGSACASTAGMGMLASQYRDDSERGRVIGIALGGLAMGVLTGPVFGSVIYQVSGKESVFLVLAGFAILLALFQLLVKGLKLKKMDLSEPGTPLTTLLCDPYILIVASSIMLGNMVIGVLETGQPIWMIKSMCSSKWELGIAFLPESVSYLIMTNLVAFFLQSVPRWTLGFAALFLISAGCVGLPFAQTVVELIGPGAVIGFGVGMVDASMFPAMAHLVDTRHTSVYGSVYAIADVAFCVSFTLGPLFAGVIISSIGFNWLMWIVAITTFIFSSLLFLLRKPLSKSEETIPILYQHKSTDDDVFTGNDNGYAIDSP